MRRLIWATRFLMFRDIGLTDLEQTIKLNMELIANEHDVTHSKVIQAKTELAILLLLQLKDKVVDFKEPIVDSDKVIRRQAIDLLREVVDSNPSDLNAQHCLASALAFSEDKADLDEAITILFSLCATASNGSISYTLGYMLKGRYSMYGKHTKDIYSAILTLLHAATSSDIDPIQQFINAQLSVDCAFELMKTEPSHFNFNILMTVMERTMVIMPSTVWVGRAMQERHDILMITGLPRISDLSQKQRYSTPQDLQSSIGQTPNKAAALAIQAGRIHIAIEWLEQGRSIIWDQLLQFRVPLDDVSQEDPQLAQKLAVLAKELAISSTKTHFNWKRQVDADGRERKVSLEAEGQKHRRLATEWQEAVADARKLPGLDKFLLPKDFDYLSRAADDAIAIIINVFGNRCNALIIFPGAVKDVLNVHLPEFTFSDVDQMHADLLSLIGDDMGIRSDLTRRPILKHSPVNFQKLLGDLWYKVVLPIICAAMEYQPMLVNCDECKNRAHVRWCPTGHLAFLPLHAAGDYSLSGKGHRVFDYIVSSYIPTLNSIIHPPSSNDSVEPTIKVLAVACPNATGQFPIPDTVEEVTRVGKHVVPLLDQPGMPVSRYIAIAKKGSATAERVLEEMKEATWVHLACHGIQDVMSPTSSALLLSDGTRLSLSDIAALNLPQAEFAFLSACQTATGYDKVPSESVHLAAGMLLAGYRSVIATMWSIADRHAPDVADDVYGYLLRDGTGRRPDYKESALALHLAMEQLRKRIGEGLFLQWVPYIHIGV